MLRGTGRKTHTDGGESAKKHAKAQVLCVYLVFHHGHRLGDPLRTPIEPCPDCELRQPPRLARPRPAARFSNVFSDSVEGVLQCMSSCPHPSIRRNGGGRNRSKPSTSWGILRSFSNPVFSPNVRDSSAPNTVRRIRRSLDVALPRFQQLQTQYCGYDSMPCRTPVAPSRRATRSPRLCRKSIRLRPAQTPRSCCSV